VLGVLLVLFAFFALVVVVIVRLTLRMSRPEDQ